MRSVYWPLVLGFAAAVSLAVSASGRAQETAPGSTAPTASAPAAATPDSTTPDSTTPDTATPDASSNSGTTTTYTPTDNTATSDTAGQSGWPCEQPERPEISTGSVWSGPDPTAAAEGWHGDNAVVALVDQIAPRRVPQDEAVAAIHRFSAGYTNDRATVLTQLFAGLFDTLNQERGEIIRGIRHFNRRQDNLSLRIQDGWKAIDALDPNSTDPAVAEQRANLQQTIDWDSRIFDDRERLLPAICQQPIVIEQRLFALSHAIEEDLDKTTTP